MAVLEQAAKLSSPGHGRDCDPRFGALRNRLRLRASHDSDLHVVIFDYHG